MAKSKKIKSGIRYFMQALQIMGIVSLWAETALEDGKVTLEEATHLAEEICYVLDVPTELEIK